MLAVPLIKAAEDSHFNFLTVSFARFYRWIGFLLAVFLPGFWMALLAYHQDRNSFPSSCDCDCCKIRSTISSTT
ncbi:spore germination protein [Bacillus cereus]|uniref:spore germination protein n=1 Tax=Bacillus cereus TaxID=1396 RepID=UPI00235178CB|nr:spore germination protein [Bacillus cereus]